MDSVGESIQIIQPKGLQKCKIYCSVWFVKTLKHKISVLLVDLKYSKNTHLRQVSYCAWMYVTWKHLQKYI